MTNKEKFKELRRQAITSALVGLALVAVYHYDPPSSLGGLIAIRVFGVLNLSAAITAILLIMVSHHLEVKK